MGQIARLPYTARAVKKADEHFKEDRYIRELTRKLAVALIERIEVYEGKRIHILFRFQMEYDSARILAGNTAVQEETAFQDITALRREVL